MKNLNISETIKKLTRVNFASKVLVVILFMALIFSLVMFFLNGYSQRRVFLFENLDREGLFAENRYFPKNKFLDEVELYVSELLLGPINERYKSVFAPGTKLKSCFIRDGVLYVDLSLDAHFTDKKVSEIREGTEIFKKNIFRNFRKIDKINIYIEGRKIFDD